MARKTEVDTPYSKISAAIGKILVEQKYIKSAKVVEDGAKKSIHVELLYKGRNPSLQGIEIISKPSVRIYKTKNALRKNLSDYGLGIVSTSKGMMTDKQAYEGKIGGELICRVF